MIWCNDCFDYSKYKGKFDTLYSIEDNDGEEEEYVVDYNKKDGLYRVTHFFYGHWRGDVIFKEPEKKSELEGFDLLAQLGYLRENDTDLVCLDDCIDIVAKWLLENKIIDEVDY